MNQMVKKWKRTVTVLLAALLAFGLSSCSSVKGNVDYSGVTIHTDPSPGAIENLVLWIPAGSEMENHNIMQSTSVADSMVLCNVLDCLLTQNAEGQLVPALAESWEKNEDATVWTFHLRQNASWADMNGKFRAACTAEDFVTGLEWVLNYYKGNAANIQMPVSFVQGAQEYLEYTRSLPKEEARKIPRETFLSYVGIETPDSTTLIYHLKKPCSYFDSITTYASFYPASQALIDEIGIDEFLLSPYYEAWYNGPYLLTEFIYGNEKIMDANPLWYGNEENTRFKSVTVKVLENSSIAYQLYKTGEVDQVKLSQSQMSRILEDPGSAYYRQLTDDFPNSSTFQFCFNYNKVAEDGTPDDSWNKAAANEAFRKSLYYGLDLTEYYALRNPIDPLSQQWDIISTRYLACLSDGTDYSELVREKIDLAGKEGLPDRLDPEKAAHFKEQAIEELTALGVTFPVTVDFYVTATTQQDIDSAKILKRIFESSLGTDYIRFEIQTTVNNAMFDAYPRGLHSISSNGWAADFGDPISCLTQYLSSDESAFYSDRVLHIRGLVKKAESGELEPWRKQLMEQYAEFERLTAAADAINDDTDARLRAFAEAESYAVEHSLTGIGVCCRKEWELTNIDNRTYCHSGYGTNMYRYVNLKTSRDGYVPERKQEETEADLPEGSSGKEADG